MVDDDDMYMYKDKKDFLELARMFVSRWFLADYDFDYFLLNLLIMRSLLPLSLEGPLRYAYACDCGCVPKKFS